MDAYLYDSIDIAGNEINEKESVDGDYICACACESGVDDYDDIEYAVRDQKCKRVDFKGL